jgi:hypothetical protein
VVAPAPSYDPWAWLLWGREVAHGTLSTEEGPAFKPLPVLACAALSALGGAAPVAWVILARAGAVLATILAFRLGRRLLVAARDDSSAAHWRRSSTGGTLAAAGVVLCGGFLGYSAAGAEPGWTIAFALLGLEAWRAGRPRAALACGVGCALLRVEAWPFLLAFGVFLWRRRPEDRGLLAAAAVAIPALWFVPELLASGDPLRSGARARVPNPGQPAEAAVPALASLREAAALPLWPLWAGAALAAALVPATRALLAAGLAWIALVAAMAQAGFSGEPRYALPGAALVAIAGAAGLAAAMTRLTDPAGRPVAAASRRTAATRRATAFLVVAALLIAAWPKVADLDDLRRDRAWAEGLSGDLERAIAAAGGRDAVLGCGRPYVGDLRGPLLAYHLDVEKRRVAFVPRPPGVVFRSRLGPDAPVEPTAPAAFQPRRRVGRWEVRTAC